MRQLCDTVLDNADPLVNAESHIDSLVRTNLFLVSLDGSGEWWRYHHLFQDLLAASTALAVFLGRKSPNCTCVPAGGSPIHGLLDDAFRHALAAGDLDAAADLIEQHRSAVMNSDKWYSVEVWLGQTA